MFEQDYAERWQLPTQVRLAHWRADIYSKVTGVTVPTELVDVAQLAEDSILTYTEFFAPR